jgi:ABC-type Fe3+-hydroxamate transport system substrate-binding protein
VRALLFRLSFGSFHDVVVSALTLGLTLTYLASTPSPNNGEGLLHTPDLPHFATLGPEAPPILSVLIGKQSIVEIQPGELANTVVHLPISALILPEDWADDVDQKYARSHGIAVVTVRRHNRIAHLWSNIETLGALTNKRQVASEWQWALRLKLERIERQFRQYPPVRVLILSPEGYTQGQDALITELIAIAGGINVAASAGIPEARQVEDAQIRAFTPDVVLLTGWDRVAASAFLRNPLYRGIPAFERSRIYLVDRLTAFGKDPSRLLVDIQHLVDLIHPAEF